jgi:hypothetical protein
MGIEPKRPLLRSLKNTAFRDSENTACDWRANFRVMRDNVGLGETPPFAIAFPLSDPEETVANAWYRAAKFAQRREFLCIAAIEI